MASHLFNLCLLFSVMGLISSGAKAQSSSTITSCASSAMSLSPCLSNNTRSSSTPTSACCSALANIVQSNPDCLCSVLNNGAGAVVGMVIPLAMPQACNIQSSVLTQCSAAAPASSSVPSAVAPAASTSSTPLADSPTGSPDDVQPEAPSSDFPTGSGTNTLPTFQGTSDGSMAKSSLQAVVFVVSIIAWTSAVTLF